MSTGKPTTKPVFLKGEFSFAADTVTAFRNIYTCFPTQNLYDDLVGPEDFPVLQAAEALTSGVDHSLPHKNRVFQYGAPTSLESMLEPQHWGGRFSDNTFGVWYGATDEPTSVEETLYHWMKRVTPDRANTPNPISTDRKMFKVHLESQVALDLCLIASLNSWLTEDDYARCRQLGRWLVSAGVGFVLAPSARKKGGVCVPTFAATAIRNEQPLYFLRYWLSPGADKPIALHWAE